MNEMLLRYEEGVMDYRLMPVSVEDGKAIIDIYNHYVKNSFAAYPENEVPYELFPLFLEMAKGYPFLVARDGFGKVLGFGFLHPHDHMSVFSQVAEITYFIAPEYIGQGIGSQILDCFLGWAREKGITSILASISSLNSGSLAFHKRNGFVECGRFVGIGRKNGREFDVVWMQRIV